MLTWRRTPPSFPWVGKVTISRIKENTEQPSSDLCVTHLQTSLSECPSSDPSVRFLVITRSKCTGAFFHIHPSNMLCWNSTYGYNLKQVQKHWENLSFPECTFMQLATCQRAAMRRGLSLSHTHPNAPSWKIQLEVSQLHHTDHC